MPDEKFETLKKELEEKFTAERNRIEEQFKTELKKQDERYSAQIALLKEDNNDLRLSNAAQSANQFIMENRNRITPADEKFEHEGMKLRDILTHADIQKISFTVEDKTVNVGEWLRAYFKARPEIKTATVGPKGKAPAVVTPGGIEQQKMAAIREVVEELKLDRKDPEQFAAAMDEAERRHPELFAATEEVN